MNNSKALFKYAIILGLNKFIKIITIIIIIIIITSETGKQYYNY